MKNLSGLNFIQKILSGELSQLPMGLAPGIHLRLAEPGRTVFEGVPTWSHYNPIGSVHGGFASTLLDSAMGYAVQTKLEDGNLIYDPRNQSEPGAPDKRKQRNNTSIWEGNIFAVGVLRLPKDV